MTGLRSREREDVPDERNSCLTDERAVQGAVLWALLADHRTWVHRRVETIRIVDDLTARRSVSLDITVPKEHLDRFPYLDALPAIPLTFMKKEVLKRFDLLDGAGASVPMLTMEQNGRAAGDALVQTVEGWVQRKLPEHKALPKEMEAHVRAVVEGAPEDASQALDGWHQMAKPDSGDPHQKAWAVVVQNGALLSAAAALVENFVLLAVADTRGGERQLFKFAYDESLVLTGGARVLTSTGWRAERLTFETPAIALAASYHLEVLAVQDLAVVDAQMGFTTAEGLTPAEPPPDGEPLGPLTSDVHFNCSHVDPAYQGTVELVVAAERRGFVTGAALTGGLVALLLIGGAFHLESVASGQQSQVTAALLLLAPAVIAAFIVRPEEHRLASRMLLGVRLLMVANLASAVFAVALVAAGYEDGTLETLWIAVTIVAVLTAIGLVRPLVRRPGAAGTERAPPAQVFVEHVTLTVADLHRSRLFYDAALAPLEAAPHQVGLYRVFGPSGARELSLVAGDTRGVPTVVTLRALSRARVDAFYAAAVVAGGRPVERPGVPADRYPRRYAARVIDPDGHVIEVAALQ